MALSPRDEHGHGLAPRLNNIGSQLAGPYPAGTLLGLDVFAALHSLVPPPRPRPGSRPRPRPSTSSTSALHNGNHQPDANAATEGAIAVAPRANNDAAATSTVAGPVTAHNTGEDGSKGKQRFKPTLNCNACVQRKTKCDRGRPACIACLRRRQPCTYNNVAEMLVQAGATSKSGRKRRKQSHIPDSHDPPQPQQSAAQAAPSPTSAPPAVLTADGATPVRSTTTTAAAAAAARREPLPYYASPQLPSAGVPAAMVPSASTPSESRMRAPLADMDFGLASTHPSPHDDAHSCNPARPHTVLPTLAQVSARHPFGGEWTHGGSLQEVIDAMPSRQHSQELIAAYFATVHPVIPILNRRQFLAEHEANWTASQHDSRATDPTCMALSLAVFACGAQHSRLATDQEIVDVCLSACHRALCLSLYLRLHSLRRCQALLLICHCLLTGCRVTEAWTFAGMTQRQAYSLGLNRPDLVSPGQSPEESMQRARLWAAVVHQDNVLSCLLRMPRCVLAHGSGPHLPTVTDHARSSDAEQTHNSANHDGVGEDEGDDGNDDDGNANNAYLSALWKLAAFAESSDLYTPQIIAGSSCPNPAAKSQLVSQLQGLQGSFDPPFNRPDTSYLENVRRRGLILQAIEVLSIFYFQMLTLSLVTDPTVDSPADLNPTLDAAHEGLATFFALVRLTPTAANNWNTCATMAYLQSSMLGEVLVSASQGNTDSSSERRRDVRLMLAKSDFDRYVDMLDRATGDAQFNAVQTERLAVLKALRRQMAIA